MADLTGMMQAAAGAAGGGLLVQDVFSTSLYAGNSSLQTVTNNIDLDGQGGLVWLKNRGDTGGDGHFWQDTERGADYYIRSDAANAQVYQPLLNWSFLSDGFSMDVGFSTYNTTGQNYASWTFRKAPKFFDVVTYTGTGAAQNISHSLGSTPGIIIVKGLTNTGSWTVFHRSVGATKYLLLNSTGTESTSSLIWNDTAPTDTQFTVGPSAFVGASGVDYVAYLFAHDAGGFNGENAISCSSYVGNGSATGPTVTLGYEPQWLMLKRSDVGTSNWTMYDSKRDPTNPRTAYLLANTSGAEQTGLDVDFNSTGFQIKTNDSQVNANTGVYVYLAIRADM